MRIEYIKPEVQFEELALESMVATSVSVGEAIEDGTTDVNNRRRDRGQRCSRCILWCADIDSAVADAGRGVAASAACRD